MVVDARGCHGVQRGPAACGTGSGVWVFSLT